MAAAGHSAATTVIRARSDATLSPTGYHAPTIPGRPAGPVAPCREAPHARRPIRQPTRLVVVLDFVSAG